MVPLALCRPRPFPTLQPLASNRATVGASELQHFSPTGEARSSIVEFSQAELQKSEADIADADAKYQYRLSQIVLACTISSPK